MGPLNVSSFGRSATSSRMIMMNFWSLVEVAYRKDNKVCCCNVGSQIYFQSCELPTTVGIHD